MSKNYNVAILGASGLVGRNMLKVLIENDFPINKLKLLASERSAGQEIDYKGTKILVEAVNENSFDGIDLALFSPGKTAAIKWAPFAVKSGAIVVDNSSGWRMDPSVPLVVPEVNPHHLKSHNGIIANPNCSTIQMVVALKPIADKFGLKRVVVSTYQSITGAGQNGINHLNAELAGNEPEKRISKHKIAFNTVFHSIDSPDGYSEEEIKMVNETRKIMDLPELKITVTCVRVPIIGGHGESINIELDKPATVYEIRETLKNFPGIILIDNPLDQEYPTVQLADNTNPVYVGRIRKDDSKENAFNIWVVADNVRKGAATNAVQIAEELINLNII
jgi:aspartate-semialdehyde dehydrogenase